MAESLNLCTDCALKHKQPPIIEVLPQYSCSYCEKNESQILYLGQPSCLKCQNKLSIAIQSRSTLRQSEHGCQNSSISKSNMAVIHRKVMKPGSEHKVMKKVGDILNGFTFSKSSLSKLKNLLFYWSRQTNKDFSWHDFIKNVEKESPMIFVMEVESQIVGVFMSENIEKKKGSVEDKYLGCFQITSSGFQFSQLQKNKFVVRHQKHIICYGSPGSVHILFDVMEVEAEYFKDTLSHPIDQFAVIKI